MPTSFTSSPPRLCTVKLLIRNNLIKCSWGTCCFQIDIQGPCWPQTQNARPWSQQRCIPQASKAHPSPQLSAASSLRPNHQGADGEARWRKLFVQTCSEEINSSAEMLAWEGPQPCPRLLLSFPWSLIRIPRVDTQSTSNCGGFVPKYMSSSDLQMSCLILSTFYQPAKLEVV